MLKQASPTDLTQRMGQVAEAGINDAPHSGWAALMIKVRLVSYSLGPGKGHKNGHTIRGFTLASCVVM